MADIEVIEARIDGGRVSSLKVRFKGNLERNIDRDTALDWLYQGHYLIPVHGHGHHLHRAPALERVEVEEAWYIRSDTQKEAVDEVRFSGGHGQGQGH